MIIGNPYGFFAKHNKIIHLVLLLPLIYILFCFQDIYHFFQDYVSSGYSTPETTIVESYINGYMFLVAFLLAIIHLIIFFVLGSKKKNNLYYGISALYFASLLIFLLLFSNSMSSIEQEEFDATFANFVRDSARLTYLPLYIIAAITVSKGVGFNFRTLRFDGGSDLKVSEEDEEDVEINIGSGDGSFKRNLVHIIRELKYYVMENKFVVSCIGVVVFLIIGYNVYLNFQVYNKTYAINQAFNLSDFTLALKDSYITNVDYRGSIIEEDKYYLVIRIGIENQGPTSVPIEQSSFRIMIGDKVVYPSYDKASRFIDIGATYQGEVLASNNPKYYKKAEDCPKGKDYVFVYELNDNEIKASYQMRILSSLTQKYEGLDAKYKKITVKPTNLIKTIDMGKAKMNQEIKLKDTTLGKTTYELKKYEISSSYSFTYEQCSDITKKCYDVSDTIVPRIGKTLLIIEDEIVFDQSTQYYANSEHDFYSDFVTIRYGFKNNNYTHEDIETELIYTKENLVNVTPKGLTGKKIYEVPNTITTAEKIYFNINIRNKKLVLTLKD